MKNILLFFPRFSNAHFVKDVYIFPDELSRQMNCNLVVASDSEPEYLKLNSNPRARAKKISKRKSNLITQVLFILREASQSDVLFLFHYRWQSLLFCTIYKILNRNGFVYIKGDMSLEESLKIERAVRKKGNSVKEYILGIAYRSCSKYIDLLSVETSDSFDVVNGFHQLAKVGKLKLIPNGVSNRKKSGLAKERVILNVARIGTHQKNTELLLSVLSKVDLNGWVFKFVGVIEPGFKMKISQFFTDHPNLKNNVFFTGEISDPDKLYELFERSSIFCFSSRFESYGLVLNEAAYFNNYIITTDVGAAQDLIYKHGAEGVIVNDESSFCDKLTAAMLSYPNCINNVMSDLYIENIVSRIFTEIELK